MGVFLKPTCLPIAIPFTFSRLLSISSCSTLRPFRKMPYRVRTHVRSICRFSNDTFRFSWTLFVVSLPVRRICRRLIYWDTARVRSIWSCCFGHTRSIARRSTGMGVCDRVGFGEMSEWKRWLIGFRVSSCVTTWKSSPWC